MHFQLRHTFEAPLDRVLGGMFDPSLTDFLKARMKQIRDIQPLERQEEGKVVRRRMRYIPAPIIERVGPKEIPAEALAFVEESTFDAGERRGTFRNLAEHERVRKHLENSGTLSFRDLGGGRTERTIEGDLKVGNLPFLLRPLAPLAERVIYASAEKLLNEEAQVFGEFLKQKA